MRTLAIRSATVPTDGGERTFMQGDEVPDDLVGLLSPSAFTRHPPTAEDPTPAEAPPEGYDKQKVSDLEAEAKRRGIYESIEGTGADGNVVKDDLVAALQADDAG